MQKMPTFCYYCQRITQGNKAKVLITNEIVDICETCKNHLRHVENGHNIGYCAGIS